MIAKDGTSLLAQHESLQGLEFSDAKDLEIDQSPCDGEADDITFESIPACLANDGALPNVETVTLYRLGDNTTDWRTCSPPPSPNNLTRTLRALPSCKKLAMTWVAVWLLPEILAWYPCGTSQHDEKRTLPQLHLDSMGYDSAGERQLVGPVMRMVQSGLLPPQRERRRRYPHVGEVTVDELQVSVADLSFLIEELQPQEVRDLQCRLHNYLKAFSTTLSSTFNLFPPPESDPSPVDQMLHFDHFEDPPGVYASEGYNHPSLLPHTITEVRPTSRAPTGYDFHVNVKLPTSGKWFENTKVNMEFVKRQPTSVSGGQPSIRDYFPSLTPSPSSAAARGGSGAAGLVEEPAAVGGEAIVTVVPPPLDAHQPRITQCFPSTRAQPAVGEAGHQPASDTATELWTSLL
ncbi:unnamed protein product [Vitrella brassicaformis CCMP3155]|uniref:Uncharacterized protein n=1 Tax=Vitrella brassicaformis (strain CCMP3155) TaxID=1169540 RepID=A0A0G4GX67_VITBC|nr:unnamed protein product [Vitrella brassicaformis CCMP3155]|eukprot:CEM35648.1 unnamed protein product [Vitrella brassicaformis CCMP3155]